MASVQDESGARNPGIDYERGDVRIGVIALCALCALIFLAAMPFVLMAGFPGAVSDTAKRLRATPPAPRLQVDPQADLRAFRQSQDARLSSYGWVDRDKGIVRIPIEEAMRKLARQGIPGWPGAKP
jgi:hypothetical protein